MIEAKLGILWDNLPNFCFLKPTKDFVGQHDCLIRVNSRIRNDGQLHHLTEISGRDSQRVVDVLTTSGAHASADSVSSTSCFVLAETPLCPLYEVLLSTASFQLKEEVRRDYLEWNVMCRSVSVVDALVKRLKKIGVDAKVICMERIHGGRRLTQRQEQILRQAYESGFFDIPHKTDMKQLAKVLKCSPSTVDRLLRRAEKKVIVGRLETS